MMLNEKLNCLGKAIIKMHIQKIFVILAFNNQLLESAISLITKVPAVGSKLEDPVRKLLGKFSNAECCSCIII